MLIDIAYISQQWNFIRLKFSHACSQQYLICFKISPGKNTMQLRYYHFFMLYQVYYIFLQQWAPWNLAAYCNDFQYLQLFKQFYKNIKFPHKNPHNLRIIMTSFKYFIIIFTTIGGILCRISNNLLVPVDSAQSKINCSKRNKQNNNF
jgi:hypothetical protein